MNTHVYLWSLSSKQNQTFYQKRSGSCSLNTDPPETNTKKCSSTSLLSIAVHVLFYIHGFDFGVSVNVEKKNNKQNFMIKEIFHFRGKTGPAHVVKHSV